MYFNYHTLSLGDNDCILFVVVDSIIGDDGALTICGKWDVESTTRLDILFVAIIFVWCWLESMDESVELYVPLDDDDPVLLVVTKPGDDEAVNNVGIKG